MKLSKLPILGLLVITLLCVSSISLTVAWFVGASYLQIAQIDIKTKSPTLQLSTDNIDFRDSLSKQDLHQVDDFKPVSSIFFQNWTSSLDEQPIFYGEYKSITKEYMTEMADLEEATFGFFSQEIFLKSSQNVYVSMVQDTEREEDELPLFYPDETANATKARRLFNTYGYEGLTSEQITQGLNDVVKSLRVSVLVLNNDGEEIDSTSYRNYIIDPYYDKTTYYGGILDNDLSGTYDNVNGQEVMFGWVNDTNNIIFDNPILESTEPVGLLTCFNSGHDSGVRIFNDAQSRDNNFVIQSEPALAFDSPSFSDIESPSSFIIPLKANTSRRIVLSIYLEGWDSDNTNMTMFGKFFVNLQFKILRTWVE